MSISLLPRVRFGALTEITPAFLRSRDIRLLMLDFDNTIVPYTTEVPTEGMEAWLREAVNWEIPVCIVSNSKSGRVPVFCEKYGLPCILRAKKPGTRGIRECLRRYGVTPEHAALVGDQIYTDTLGANLAGVQSILIPAIDNHNFWLKARHVLEMPFIFVSNNRRQNV